MPHAVRNIPARRSELLFSPLGNNGRYVVKDPRARDFYLLREKKYFLLSQLNGKQTAEKICAAFEKRFEERLSEDDLAGFLSLADTQGFRQPIGQMPTPDADEGRGRAGCRDPQ